MVASYSSRGGCRSLFGLDHDQAEQPQDAGDSAQAISAANRLVLDSGTAQLGMRSEQRNQRGVPVGASVLAIDNGPPHPDPFDDRLRTAVRREHVRPAHANPTEPVEVRRSDCGDWSTSREPLEVTP